MKPVSISERVTVYCLFTNINKMQSKEMECKYALHTSTTITSENRLTKSTSKKIPYVCKFIYTSQCKSFQAAESCWSLEKMDAMYSDLRLYKDNSTSGNKRTLGDSKMMNSPLHIHFEFDRSCLKISIYTLP